MDIFNPTAPVLTHQRRDGEPTTVEAAWHKPVVMLIDSGTRSGKELLAYAFKKHKVGVLVGERTAGAVLGGSPRPLSDGSLLLIAVTDVRVDGEKLEGVGVSPDIEVRRDLPYSAGKDPQIEAAVRVLTK
jgi:carboxyl-terminal processing protease